MIGLDTNVLIRYLTQDDPVQSAKATELIEKRLSEDKPGFLSSVVIAEAVWVLTRAYRFTGSEVAAAVERILQADVFVVQDTEAVFSAMIALRKHRVSFADALIAALAIQAGCSHTVTFDRDALRFHGFAAL